MTIISTTRLPTRKSVLITKDKWGDGEWQNEPDYEEFIYEGYLCIARRNMSFGGHWCGYVQIDRNNKYSKEEHYNKLNIHGWISYYQKTFRGKKNNKNKFWIGFDCMHVGDFIPLRDVTLKNFKMNEDIKLIMEKLFGNDFFLRKDDTYKNLEFVKNELKKLVDQIKEG